MTVTINGTTGIDKVQPGAVTSSSLASGQTLAVNGITFPAAQSASSDANTLDDYEEGTFTPTWLASSSNPTVSGQATCSYTKIGRLVTITGDWYASSVSGGSGDLYIGNLPFVCASGATYQASAKCGVTTTWSATGAPTTLLLAPGNTYVRLHTNSSSDPRSTTGTAVTVASSGIGNYSEIFLSFSYLTN